MIRKLIAFAAEIIALLGPAFPRQWADLARHLARGPGWVPSMMLLATFGGTFFINELLNKFFNGVVADAINVATYASWSAVCGWAILLATRRSAGNVLRLGANGLLRARWWFECAAPAWNLTVLSFLVTLAASWSAAILNQPQIETLVWQMGRVLTGGLLAVFAVAGTVGYAISLARRRWPRGRACQCAHYYLLMPLGGGCLIAAVECWPIRGWLDGVILIGGSALACVAIGTCIVVVGRSLETSWRRDAANHGR